MASVGFGTVAPAMASPAAVGRRLGRRAARPSSSAHVPAATKSVAAAAKAAPEGKGLFDLIFGPLYKEEQLLETDPILNKVEGKAAARKPGTVGKKAAGAGAGAGNGGFSLGGLFSKE
ncbi:hypothetical protein ACP4OV_006963 [Aristida adscensionis]